MKKILIATVFLFISFFSNAQFGGLLKDTRNAAKSLNSSGVDKTTNEEKTVDDGKIKGFTQRGAVAPVDLSYKDYKSYAVTLGITPDFETALHAQNVAYSPTKIENELKIVGLSRLKENPDFNIYYNITRFENVRRWVYKGHPSFEIGLEANLEIKDRDGKSIYKRYFTPQIRTYIVNNSQTGTNGTYEFESLVYGIVKTNFYNLLQEFSNYYLYGPVLNLDYFGIKKEKDLKNLEEFNASTQVFPILKDVSRDQWPQLFGEAQKYWKEHLTYADSKDEDVVKRARFASAYNLAVSNLLLGNLDECEKYLPIVKENEKKLLGMRFEYPKLVEDIDRFKAYKASTDRATSIEPIEPTPDLPAYKKGPDVFHFATLNGEAVDDDEKHYTGEIRIYSDSPEIVDLRTDGSQQSKGVFDLLDGIGSDKSTVRIKMEGEKKEKKTNLKKLVSIKTTDGKVYFTGKTGDSGVLTNSTINTKRYALFEEIKVNNKLILCQEFFPQDAYVLKKPTKDEYYSPPVLIGRKSSLKAFFEDCPAMLQNIDKGLYNFENKDTYLRMFDDYVSKCGSK